MAEPLKISLHRIKGATFEGRNAEGNTMLLDGPASLGGQGIGLRPMETVLVGLAGCSAMDVLMIMEKQRQPLIGLDVEVEGVRADAVPAVFERIELTFIGSGEVSIEKLEHAVQLSMEKYCSVAKMLQSTAEISAHAKVVPA